MMKVFAENPDDFTFVSNRCALVDESNHVRFIDGVEKIEGKKIGVLYDGDCGYRIVKYGGKKFRYIGETPENIGWATTLNLFKEERKKYFESFDPEMKEFVKEYRYLEMDLIEDAKRIRNGFLMNKRRPTIEQCIGLWSEYSQSCDANWIPLDGYSPQQLYAKLIDFIKRVPKMPRHNRDYQYALKYKL